MHPFESLLRGSEKDVAAMFARFGTELSADVDRRIDEIGHQLGLNASQLVCGFGFNRNAANLPRVLNVLGFSSFDAMWSHRNYVFINDAYHGLSIDNILDIYSEVSDDPEAHDLIPDLILSRLNNIEAQIEATINPVMLGSYKLEIRAVYENHLASPELVETRLSADYEVLRGIADEIPLMVRNGASDAWQILGRQGVSPEEKRRLYFLELVSADDLRKRLENPAVGELERKILSEALEQQ